METAEGCIVIQTCDKYQFAWKSLFWSMEKYWDFDIPWKIYFCNEHLDVSLPNEKYEQIKTGSLDHCGMMKKIMNELHEYKYVFYMLEDFWPTSPMSKETFMGLFKIFKENDWDSLKVTVNQPSYYKLENTNFSFNGKKILKYAKDSDWQFNQQASFWKRKIFQDIITHPQDDQKEGIHKTSLGTEIAMDKELRRRYPESEIYLYNYLWYPVGGSVWRGDLTFIGKQIEFERSVDDYMKAKYP